MQRHRWFLVALGLLAASRLVAAEPSEKVPVYPPPAEVKAAFVKLLDRPKIDPAPQTISEPRHADGLVTEHLSIATERKVDGSVERMPMLIVRPERASGRLPAVVVLHGTGGNKEAYRGFCTQLAKRGMVAIAIDARYHGERIPGGAHGNQQYVAAIARAWRAKPGEPQEHPFYFDTCWDLWRLLDYLQTRDDVDPRRIGMYGVSMGAIEIWLAASVDDRVAVVVPAIGVQSLRWTLEHDVWQGRAGTIRGAHEAAAKDLGEPAVNARVCRELWNKVVPGILDQFDCPSMIRLFAGRPMLILSGEIDPNNPLGGAKIAFASAAQAYEAAGASDKLKIDVAAGVPHRVTDAQRDEAIAWLAKWLAKN
jgi:dienelactone hydrolase